jgi:hypothetical protein
VARPGLVVVTTVSLDPRTARDGETGPVDLSALPDRVEAAFGRARGIRAASTEAARRVGATPWALGWRTWVTGARPRPLSSAWWSGPIATPEARAPVVANSTPSFTTTPVLDAAPAPTATSGADAAFGAVVSHFASGQGVIPVTARRRVALARWTSCLTACSEISIESATSA